MKEVKGIDVSKYQGNIDWAKVKADGVEFAIIRAGYGKLNRDNKFKANVEGCIKNAISVGAYWFMYCINEQEALANAQMCEKVIEPYKNYLGMKVWCDFEYDTDKKANARGIVFNKNTRTACVETFCKYLKGKGYSVGVYANQDYIKNKFNTMLYPLWFAKYSSSKGTYEPTIWQYTSSGSVAGIEGNVDMDIFYDEEVTAKAKMPTLKKGAKGSYVKILQTALNKNGSALSVDGSFGAKTETSLKDYQKKKNLKVDGICGSKTWASLGY